ncbi:6-hydroxymethylpterin diphosphokinase MptE-like protein [Shewanella gaetbuli]|uniref:DUF115 domain-containing protein n=1 Tax=Shewanella gaetbuli TaxID=220752 RepID=A0A9X1ZPI5_9GAMM|nr:6-hydroxymethylpterin diphosphokinase MptE-like protein [Shewanella gaetbuli]MCL1141718.1 DUF115 domain-containing protein [Shewanella gaetbuli]
MLPESEILNVFAVSAFDEYYLPSINRNTFEKLDSKSLFDKHFKSSFAMEDTLHIIIGLDSGLLANYVMENKPAEGSHFIFVEIDEVFKLLNIDIPSEKNHVQVCHFSELEGLLSDSRLSVFLAKRQYCIHRSLAAAGDYLLQYSLLGTQVDKLVDDIVYQESIGFSQKVFIREQLRNICENRFQAKVFSGRFDNMTAIVVAGGPSLDETIGWIKDNQSKLIIFAVSRVAGKLSEAGIVPHIIVSVDPEDFSFEVNRGMLALAGKSIFVNSYHVSSRLLSQWQGLTLYMGSRLPWSQVLDGDNIQTMGPTVTNSAVHLAINLGFKKVLLTGSDFCFSAEGFTHSKGSLETSLGPNLGFIGEWVTTYAGHKAETAVQLKLAAESLANDVAQHPQVSVCNLSKNATKIDKIPYCEHTSIVLEDCHLTPADFHQMVEAIYLNQSTEDDFYQVLNQTTTANDTFNWLVAQTQQALLALQKVKSEVHSTSLADVSTQVDSIEAEINHRYSDFSKLIKFYGYLEFSAFLSTKTQQDWDEEHMLQMSLSYYQAFHDIAKDLAAQTASAISRINNRINERKANVSLCDLAKTWRADYQPGRVHIWQKYHAKPLEKLSPPETAMFTELEAEFHQQFIRQPQVYIDVVKNQSASKKVLEKILHLVHHKHVEGLAYLSRNLLPLTQHDDDAKYLYSLSSANQLFLENKPSEALQAIQQYKGKHDEHYLKLTLQLSLTLAKLDLASDTLQKLIEYSDLYLPFYAHVLRLQGHLNQAVNIYLDYLEKYPSDVTTWLKLGMFMVDVNQIDSAFTAFSNALNADPNNQVAQDYIHQIEQACQNAE